MMYPQMVLWLRHAAEELFAHLTDVGIAAGM
jgi:hypothetical protein